MGRIKIKDELKKDKISVTISEYNFNKFEELEIKNKSRLINWLLEGHFGMADIKAEEGKNNER